jgi:hypothetical protein
MLPSFDNTEGAASSVASTPTDPASEGSRGRMSQASRPGADQRAPKIADPTLTLVAPQAIALS